MFNERQDVFPAYRLHAGDRFCFQKLQKKPTFRYFARKMLPRFM